LNGLSGYGDVAEKIILLAPSFQRLADGPDDLAGRPGLPTCRDQVV
jgi:hypothetical protein